MKKKGRQGSKYKRKKRNRRKQGQLKSGKVRKGRVKRKKKITSQLKKNMHIKTTEKLS